jgi:hypothetical protein
MKKSLLVLSGLAICALLTGCTSTPAAPVITVEDQAKLIEYDNCLKVISSGKGTPSLYYDYTVQECAKYRP